MLCIRQNQSSSFNGPISHSSSATNLDLFQQFNCDEDFQDINLADFSLDVPLDDSLDQMFNNQQSTFDSIGLSSGYSTPTSSSLSTTTPTPSSTPIPPQPTTAPATIISPIQLNPHHRSSSGLSFTENTINQQSVNPDNNNNNRSNTFHGNIILNSNQGSLIGSSETSSSSTPTTPNSATLPSFMEIYSPRNFPQQSTSQQSQSQSSQQHQQQSQSQSGLNCVADDASSFFKFDEIGDLNDDDNTSLSTVSFGSVSLQKSGQPSGSLIDLSFVKQEDVDQDDDIVSLPISIQTALNQHQHSHYHHQQHPYRSHQNQDATYTRASSVASSPGYISLSSTRSTPNPDHYQQPPPPLQYVQPLQQQYQHNHQHQHQHQIQYHQQVQQHQHSPNPRSSYQPIELPSAPNIISSGSNRPSASIEHSMRSQMNISRSSFSSSLSGSPNIFGSNSNILGYSSRTSSVRSSPTELVQISGSKSSKASLVSSGKGALSTFTSSLSATASATTTSQPSTGASTPTPTPAGQTPLHQLCAVCGDNAACQHYGVRTCEGCKGFFKRTVQKGSKYVCLGSKDCPVDKRRRNRCQFCRFQKCLSVGMVKEVVRTDGLKGRRGRLPSKPKSPQEPPPSPPVSTITALVRAHVDTCPDISNLDITEYCEFDEPTTKVTSSPVYCQQFIDLMNTSLDPIRTFAEKIPGFNDLNKHDQDLLFYSSCLEMITLRIAYQNKPGSKKIILPNGVMLHRNQAKLLFGAWFTNLELFSSRFAQIDIDISAFACLLGLSLITVRHGLVDPIRVEGLQMKIIESLRDHVTYNAEAQKKAHYFSSILSKLPDLRSLSVDGLTHLHEIQMESIVTIPESLSRLFNNALYF